MVVYFCGNCSSHVYSPVNSPLYFYSCVPELRPASTVPIVALVVALIGTLTCLVLVFINYRKTRKVLIKIQRQSKEIREANKRLQQQESNVSSQHQQQLLEDMT